MKHKTLLEKIMEARIKRSPIQSLSPEAMEEGEVLIAWVCGDIDTAEATKVLGVKSNSQIYQRAGTAMRNLAREGHISIIWNAVPKEEENNGNDQA